MDIVSFMLPTEARLWNSNAVRRSRSWSPTGTCPQWTGRRSAGVRKSGGSYVYFILCSSTTEVNARQLAFAAGVDDFLTKPVDPNELLARLVVARRILASEHDLKQQRFALEKTAHELAESNVEQRALSRKYSELFMGCLSLASRTTGRDSLGSGIASRDGIRIPFSVASGEPVWRILGKGRYAVWSESRSRSLLGSERNEQFDWCHDRPDGDTRYFAANIIRMLDDQSKPYGVVCANIDITERRQAEAQIAEYAMQVEAQRGKLVSMNAKLNQLAITDELTGLSNRRHFREQLTHILQNRNGSDISLLLLDLDHFKRVNDARGHWRETKSCANSLESFVRPLSRTKFWPDMEGRSLRSSFLARIKNAPSGLARDTGAPFKTRDSVASVLR